MLTQEQFEKLRSQGLSVDQIVSFEKGEIPKKKEGFLSTVFRAITEPVVTLASRPIQATKMIAGATPEQADINLPYYGKIKAPRGSFGSGGGKEILADVGRGAETIALGIGGGGAVQTAKTGLKGLVMAGAKQGAITGAKAGGLIGFGQSLQEAEVQPADVAFKTLFGAATGGVTGGALGAITPVVVKGVNTVRKFTNIESLNKELETLNNTVFKPTPKTVEKWGQQKVTPIKTYTQIFGEKLPEVDKSNRFIKESVDEFVDKVDQVYKPASAGFNTILRNSPEVNSLAAIEKGAINKIKESGLVASQKNTAIAKIKSEFIALKNQLKGQILGDDNIPVALTDNLKDSYWGATRYFGPEEATVANETNRAIARTLAENIENSITDVNVKNYNKGLQELIVLKDWLGNQSGKLSGTGGKMTRLMSRVVGAVAGSKGGPLGSAFGSMTGDKLAQIWINPKYSPYRWLITKQLQKLPIAERQALEDQANEVIQQMFQKRMQTLALPGRSGESLGASINAGRPIPVLPPTSNKEFFGNRDIMAGGEYVPPKQSSYKIRNIRQD